MNPFKALTDRFWNRNQPNEVEKSSGESHEWPQLSEQAIDAPPVPAEVGEPLIATYASRFLSALQTASGKASQNLHAAVVQATIAGVRQISSERDRAAVVDWFVGAREILARGEPTTQTAIALYRTIDSTTAAKLAVRILLTSLRNYQSSRLPLTLKVALPVTAVGIAVLGSQGAGVTALGTGVGLPVVLLLFLGVAGVTSIVEAFASFPAARDPLTQLMLTFAAFEQSRRAKKALLDAIRADTLVPRRADIPKDANDVLAIFQSMDPVEFERHVMSLFEPWGYPTGLTPRSNDFGVDGFIMHPDGVIIVQCKRYGSDNPVGRPTVQQFKGVVEEQEAFHGYIVTTSRFTNEAKESAGKSTRLTLIDADIFLDWHSTGFAEPAR